MSLNPDIIQFVTDTTARIHQNYPAATQQQRLILDKNTGLVFWDVDYTRYKVNTTPKISYTVNLASDALVTGDAVFVHVQDIANSLEQQILAIAFDIDTELSDTSQNPVLNRAIKAGIDLALSDAKQYTDLAILVYDRQLKEYISDTASDILSDALEFADIQTANALSDANNYTDSKFRLLESSYVSSAAITTIVLVSDSHIPTGGAIHNFVLQAISHIQPQLQSLSLAGLADVAINQPVTGQVLSYNSTLAKWLNKTVTTVTVDTLLSNTSVNPVLNRAIKAGIDSALSDAKLYIDSQSQLISSGAALYTDSKCQLITSTYIPISSIAQAVQLNDTNIPTGGAVYSFVQSSIALILPLSESLAGLVDTDITGPADGQVLAYNSNTSKWYNKTIQSGTAGISWTLYV